MAYRLDIKSYGLAGDCKDAKEFFQLRKSNLKVTNIFWVTTGVEIDPYYIDCTYEFKAPILVFLN